MLEQEWGLDEGEEITPGRYAMRLLGGGHRFEAYVAWDDDLYCPVVVKVLRPHLIDDPDAVASLRAEARLLAGLAHPSLVRMLSDGIETRRPHVVLELVEGPRLSTLRRRYGLAIEQVLPLGLSLASVLHYLARRHVVHLDVKPRNIIMAGPPKLIDLSVARTSAEVASIRGPIGTDAYMAPEQCDPSRFSLVGAPADVWGLGVTLYEAVSGRLPFSAAAESGVEIRYPQLLGEPEPLDRRVPPDLAELLMACLRRDPPDRPTAGDVAEALEPLVDRLPRPRIGRFRPGSTPSRHRASVA